MSLLMLIELNEINFDLVRRYVDAGSDLPVLADLMREGECTSMSEDVYENLEPWI